MAEEEAATGELQEEEVVFDETEVEGEFVEDAGEVPAEGEAEAEAAGEAELTEGDFTTTLEASSLSERSYGEINTTSFDEFVADEKQVAEAQEAWRQLQSVAGSRENAGLAIWVALFESAPSLQHLFVSPKAVAAMKFFEGINSFVSTLDNPASLKVKVETLCFGHLALDVTPPRVVLFRDAILDLMQVELGSRFSNVAYIAWKALLNYVGGAIIYIKAHYGERLRILAESWALANVGGGEGQEANKKVADQEAAEGAADKKAKKAEDDKEHHDDEKKGKANIVQNVPTTFSEMFLFNSAVMGFGSATWMQEVLGCFDNIVNNISNTNRFQEECDVLTLRMARVATKVNLADYKSCMLASLRSLLPKDWTTAHEVAWSWLWENVERVLYGHMGKPPIWEKAWTKFLGTLDEATAFQFRADVYAHFFSICPTGQDYFKQSNTYLHLMAIKICGMTVDMYREPVRMTDDISALGLRHVGYGIPTEFFGPWVTTWMEVLATRVSDEMVIQGLRYSLGLITRSLVRTIMEGSTIVMKAINTDSKRSMQKALACAPRGERAAWMLKVQVGTQAISPLAWSIDSGALEAASEMLNDLLTFRADRDAYYYGADEMFTRHSDLVKKLIDGAPVLLPELLNGLIWRSRLTFNGYRRVNYYMKHMLVDPDGNFHKTLQWLVRFKDPAIVCHPTVMILSDVVWSKVARFQFFVRKAWFMLTLFLFALDKAILEHTGDIDPETGEPIMTEKFRIKVFIFRIVIYVFSFGSLAYTHLRKTFVGYRKGDTVTVFKKVKLPAYLNNWQEAFNLILVSFLFCMLVTEPILHCMTDPSGELFATDCPAGEELALMYSIFSMFAMFLYFILLVDLAVFSNSVMAYVLVCGHMLAELWLFLFLGGAIIFMFSTGMSALYQDIEEFQGVPVGMKCLTELFLNMLGAVTQEHFKKEVIVVMTNWCFMITLMFFLGNMLVAQLTCAYGTIYADTVGYARLKRIRIITESMPFVKEKRWKAFVRGLKLDEKLEFNEGDIGLAGGIATTEPANAHPTNVDIIKRVGGSTSPMNQWPEESAADDDTDRFDRMEKALQKMITNMGKKGGKKKHHGGTTSSAGHSSANDKSGTGEDMATEEVVEEEE